jgi:hypothetical protein
MTYTNGGADDVQDYDFASSVLASTAVGFGLSDPSAAAQGGFDPYTTMPADSGNPFAADSNTTTQSSVSASPGYPYNVDEGPADTDRPANAGGNEPVGWHFDNGTLY